MLPNGNNVFEWKQVSVRNKIDILELNKIFWMKGRILNDIVSFWMAYKYITEQSWIIEQIYNN